MPMFSYECPDCSGLTEELFFGGEDIADTVECGRCKAQAKRVIIGRIAVIGADSGYLEAMSKAHFSKKDLRAGKSFRSQKELSQFEDSKKMRRLIPGTPDYNRNQDYMRDQASTLSRVKREKGSKGLVDYCTKSDIQSKHGWTDSKYHKWKEASNVATRAYDPTKHTTTSRPPARGGGGDGT